MNGHQSDSGRPCSADKRRRFHTNYRSLILPVNQFSKLTSHLRGRLLKKFDVQRRCSDARALDARGHHPDGGHSLLSQTHSPVLPLRKQKRSLQSTPAVFQLSDRGGDRLASSPLSLSSPFLLPKYNLTSLTFTSPSLPLSPPLSQARSFQPPLQQKKQRRLGHFPSLPLRTDKLMGGGGRPTDHRFQSCRDRAQKKSLHELQPAGSCKRLSFDYSILK